ncbi:hypothetical protein EDB83DRAFT_2324932 [Lactarius deliciosus]|nr:hypothetical protein EDB83DRAFT_2324932 [Lactarius deliciosus]
MICTRSGTPGRGEGSMCEGVLEAHGRPRRHDMHKVCVGASWTPIINVTLGYCKVPHNLGSGPVESFQTASLSITAIQPPPLCTFPGSQLMSHTLQSRSRSPAIMCPAKATQRHAERHSASYSKQRPVFDHGTVTQMSPAHQKTQRGISFGRGVHWSCGNVRGGTQYDVVKIASTRTRVQIREALRRAMYRDNTGSITWTSVDCVRCQLGPKHQRKHLEDLQHAHSRSSVRQEAPSADPTATAPQSRGGSNVTYRSWKTSRIDDSDYRSRGVVGGGRRRRILRATLNAKRYKRKAQRQCHTHAHDRGASRDQRSLQPTSADIGDSHMIDTPAGAGWERGVVHLSEVTGNKENRDIPKGIAGWMYSYGFREHIIDNMDGHSVNVVIWYQLVQAKKSYGKVTPGDKYYCDGGCVAVAVVIGSWGRDRIVPHCMEDHKGLEALARRVGTCMSRMAGWRWSSVACGGDGVGRDVMLGWRSWSLARCVGDAATAGGVAHHGGNGLMHAPGVVEWFGASRGGNKAMAAAVSVQQAGGGGSRGWQCCAVSCNS